MKLCVVCEKRFIVTHSTLFWLGCPSSNHWTGLSLLNFGDMIKMGDSSISHLIFYWLFLTFGCVFFSLPQVILSDFSKKKNPKQKVKT